MRPRFTAAGAEPVLALAVAEAVAVAEEDGVGVRDTALPCAC